MATFLLFQLGSNGYSFAVNGNGYIVFHPNLKAKVIFPIDEKYLVEMDKIKIKIES